VRCKTCDADLIFREMASGSTQRPFIHGTGLARCPGCQQEQLVDAALHSGGRYYLPYRLHASADQFRAAYPQSAEFFRLKQKYDPKSLFENEFYLKYAKP
jgi:hypothetical protein